MSGMFEMVGKMIAHSLVQGGPGFPCLALPCFYYRVTGDVMCAFAYCDVWDIPDPSSRNIVLQVHAQYVLGLFLSKAKISFKTPVNTVSLHCTQTSFKTVHCSTWLSNQ